MTIKKAVKIKEKDIEEIYEKYKNQIFAYIYLKIRNKEESEDILSKTFIKFIRYSKKKDIYMESIKPLLYKIASNIIIDHFRKKKIIKILSFNALNSSTEEEYIEVIQFPSKENIKQQAELNETIKKINKIVEKLPEKQREAFYLRFMEGFSFKEISYIQNTNISTALSRVRYAVDKIKETIKGDFL